MSQNQEIIESKLCSFVDGELDEAGRAEIEKHLTANPQHRRLLEELRRTSALVRGLPRENAPVELAESFTSQLERSVLLQGVEEDSDRSALRIGPGPRLYAAAAIILLMIGLAAVIYFALPSYNVHPTMASSTVRQPTAPSHVAAPPAPSERDEQNRIASSDSTKENFAEKQLDASTAKRSAGEQPIASAPLDESRQLRALARKAASDSDALGATDASIGRRQISAAGAPSIAPAALVMLIQSNDLDRTHRRLTDYFAANGISWAPAADASDGIAKSEWDARTADRAAAPLPGRGVVRQGSPQESKRGRIDPAAAAALPPGAISGAATEPTAQQSAVADNAPLPATPQTEPAADGKDQALAGQDLSLHPVTHSDKPGAAPAGQAVVFAARMSRRQAAALGDVLEQEGAAQQARVVEDGASLVDAGGKDAEQLSLNGAKAKGAAAFGAGTPAARPSVAFSGSVDKEQEKITPAESLKKTDGSPTTQLADAIPSTRPDESNKYRNLTERGGLQARGSTENLRSDAAAGKDTTQPATTAPSDAPLAAEAQPSPPSPVINPAASLNEAAAPSTVPSSALSLSPAGLDELVNVVILVRPNNAAQSDVPVASAAPQTQPAAPATEPADSLPTPPASQPTGQ